MSGNGRSNRLTILLTDDERQEIDEAAMRARVSLSAWVRMKLRDAIERAKKK